MIQKRVFRNGRYDYVSKDGGLRNGSWNAEYVRADMNWNDKGCYSDEQSRIVYKQWRGTE